jgi:DDE superfamily endonuclease
VTETVALLAARSPKLRTALAAARKAGHAYIIIDGMLVPIDRVAADRPFYSGKHRRHGMNLQVISAPDGDIVGVAPERDMTGWSGGAPAMAAQPGSCGAKRTGRLRIV